MGSYIRKLKESFHSIKKQKLSQPVKDLFLAIIVGAIVSLASASGLFQKFEYITLDGMFKLRGQRANNANIAIIEIDDTSLEILGRWPWPRDYHAGLLRILNVYEPRFVVFDILFPESDIGGDAVLAMVAGEGRNVYLASYFMLEETPTSSASDVSDTAPLPPLTYNVKGKEKFFRASGITLPVEPLLSVAKGVGVVNAPPDTDGSTRHLPLIFEYHSKIYPSLSLQLACDYLGIGIDEIELKPGAVLLPFKKGKIPIPVDPMGRIVLNFAGAIDTFKRYSYIELLHDYNRTAKEGGKSILEELKDKIVFIGYTATGSVDARIMPFSNFYPAVGVHATALSNILDRDLLRGSPPVVNIAAVLAVSILLGMFVKRGRKVNVNLGIMLILFFAYALLSFAMFAAFNLQIYTFAPLVAILSTYATIAIGHYEAVRYEKKILENELLIARTIQQSFLPKKYPDVPFLEFAAQCNPAKQVGGDLYDFIELKNEKIGIIIGDVSGKGVPAALYMARAISEFRTVARLYNDAAETLKSLNDVFAKEGMEKSFITMQYLMIDLPSRKLTFSNGGHNTILHFVMNGQKIEEMDTESGMPIGMIEGVDFENKEIPIKKGDMLIFYTDGISEARDRRQREFGIEKVKDIIINNAGSTAGDVMSKIFDELEKFSKGAPQHDDMTLIVVKAV